MSPLRYRATAASICDSSFIMNEPRTRTGSRIADPDRMRKLAACTASNVASPPLPWSAVERHGVLACQQQTAARRCDTLRVDRDSDPPLKTRRFDQICRPKGTSPRQPEALYPRRDLIEQATLCTLFGIGVEVWYSPATAATPTRSGHNPSRHHSKRNHHHDFPYHSSHHLACPFCDHGCTRSAR